MDIDKVILDDKANREKEVELSQNEEDLEKISAKVHTQARLGTGNLRKKNMNAHLIRKISNLDARVTMNSAVNNPLILLMHLIRKEPSR